MGYLDMHIHSTLSDGSLQPEQVLSEAVKNGVSLVSITDHDIIPSRDHWKYLSFKNKKIKLVPGIEISTDYYLDGQKVRIHLLSYDVESVSHFYPNFVKFVQILLSVLKTHVSNNIYSKQSLLSLLFYNNNL